MRTRGDVNVKRLARKLCLELMTNGAGQAGRRLQLRGPNEEDLGGLCTEAVLDVLEKVLRKELKEVRP